MNQGQGEEEGGKLTDEVFLPTTPSSPVKPPRRHNAHRINLTDLRRFGQVLKWHMLSIEKDRHDFARKMERNARFALAYIIIVVVVLTLMWRWAGSIAASRPG